MKASARMRTMEQRGAICTLLLLLPLMRWCCPGGVGSNEVHEFEGWCGARCVLSMHLCLVLQGSRLLTSAVLEERRDCGDSAKHSKGLREG